MTKNLKITIPLVALGIFLSPIAYAFDYPELGGVKISSTTTAAQYFVYFFNLIIAIGTFVAVVIIILAGTEYVLARGDTGKIGSAKDKIRNTFLGLAVLLGSYMILNIINPSLTTVKINTLPYQQSEAEVVPEGKGVYLYSGENFTESSDKTMILTETKAGFVSDNNFETKSIKFANPDNYKFGAVLFDDSNLRGSCSYLLSDLPGLNTVLGNENNPAIGNLLSIAVFKIKSEGTSVKLYNNINCSPRLDDYCRKGDEDFPCQTENNKMCTITSGSGFDNIASACPDFDKETGVLSIEVSGNTGILLKSADKDSKGRCQLFQSGNTTCINMVKYGYVYRSDYSVTNTSPDLNLPGVVLPNGQSSTSVLKIKPVSIMLFPLYSNQ